MKALDTRGRFTQISSDPQRKIPKAHLHTVCKKGQGACACRYIFLVADAGGDYGFTCVKHSPLQGFLDEQVTQGKLKATGNNCEGLVPYVKENAGPKSSPQSDSKDSKEQSAGD